MRKLSVSTPVIFLCGFLLIVQIGNALYAAVGREPSPAFQLLYAFGFFWVIGWWLKDDNKKYRVDWVYDLGFFLYLAWVFIIPFYLFKTRRMKAFVTILSFAGIFFGTYLVGLAVWLLVTFWATPAA